MTEHTPPPPATAQTEGTPTQSWLPSLPAFVTGPVEAFLKFVGSFATTATSWVGDRGQRATARARPWLEFVDFSAFGPAEGGLTAYIERLKLNAPYFMFNYILLGLALTVFSVVTKPFALVGSIFLVWLYFQFFGSEADEEFHFMGLQLDNVEKMGTMVFLGFLVFWFTAGGLGIFVSVLSAVAFVTLIHGCLRKPSPDAIPTV